MTTSANNVADVAEDLSGPRIKVREITQEESGIRPCPPCIHR